MRPIDADKLIEYFQERLYVYEGNDDTKERYAHMAYVRSLNAIKNAPTIEIPTKCVAQISIDSEEIIERIKEEYNIVDAWIPCSERLPETRDRYLISYRVVGNEYVTTAVWGKPPEPRTDIRGNHFYEPDDEYGDFVYDVEGEVIAWMPLPEPYKEDEDGK